MRKKKSDLTPDDEEKPSKRSAPDGFCEWWYPARVDPISGASVGGHPDAERTWARKDVGRWTRRTYGISAATAYQAATYRQEYNVWRDAGSPEQDTPFVSVAVGLPKLNEYWKTLLALLAAVPKPVRRPRQTDYDKGKAPWIEPIDERKALPPHDDTVDAEFVKLPPEENTNEPIEF